MVKKVLEPSTLIPCMVTLVTCHGTDHKPNVLAISEGGVLNNYPPVIGISISRVNYSNKLVKETLEFVMNVPSEEMLRESDICGHIHGNKKDKFALTGLTLIPSRVVSVPSIKECPINIECKVSQVIDMGAEDLFIGNVVANVVDEEILNPGTEDMKKIAFGKPVLSDRWKPIINVHGTGCYWNLKGIMKPLMYTAKEFKADKDAQRDDIE